MSAPVLIGARCRVRPFTERDLDEFARYRALPEVARFQSWSEYTIDDARRLYDAQQAVPFGTVGSWHQLAIADRVSDRLLGDCALHFLDERQVEIGLTLAPEHQRKGLAREALRLLLDHLFAEMKRHRVTALTDAENLAAQRLLRALGFRQEAHFRQNVLFKGRWGDESLFALLAGEWKRPAAVRAAPEGLVLRRARRDELESLLHLLAQDVIRDRPEELGPPVPRSYLDAFDAIDRSEHQRLIVAELDGKRVGTLTLTFVRYLSFGGSEVAIVENVRVDAAHRSRGIGEAMMRWAEDEARRRGATRIQLTSNRQRLDAHRFYERLGYAPSHLGFKKMLR